MFQEFAKYTLDDKCLSGLQRSKNHNSPMSASSPIFLRDIQMFSSKLHPCCFVILLYILVLYCPEVKSGTLFQDCGGVYEKSKGVIYTPGFPNAYPTPIKCEWLIHAPPDKKIILYFTQFYMKDSFYLTEYDAYQDTSTYIGRHDLGRISSWQDDLLSLAAYKPYVLIQFNVESIGNRHLRVIDSMLDVYGFNITYEIVDRNSDVTKDTCSVKECSYLGNCIVSHDFSQFKCECFEGFFGNQCQYGPYCDPDADPPINQCSNGGRCKYFMGSMINQCECLPGFYGAHCETASGSDSELDQECQVLQCSQLCAHIDGRATCLCREGYRMDMDNGTCIPIARYRMDVTLKLMSFTRVPDNQYERSIDRAKQLIARTIEENGVSTISKFGIKGLRNSSTTSLLEFYFYCKVSEVDFVDQALRAVVNLGKIGNFTLMDTSAILVQSPELHLAEVTNNDPQPALQGKLLTLVCAARGSANMVFQWYKDGYKVETGLTQRSAWETMIPETVDGLQLSVLNIDNVTPFDAGTFTCEVKDFGDVQHKHVLVEVKGYPQVDLGPMSASIPKGRQVSIKCISPDDGWQQFIYEWFKNGVKISPDSYQEYAEDMFPTGVRLVVSAVTSYAEYTCKVTNEAGSANVTAYIYAIDDNETGLYCPENKEGHVMWQETSGGHFDIQRCPTEQGVVSPFSPGYARRKCQCEAGATRTDQCAWTKPNFAKCQSIFLIKIYDELEALRLGYQQTTLKSVFDQLYRYVLPSKPTTLYSGDIDMVAGILKELLVHMKNFPQLVSKDDKISAQHLIHLMSEIVVKLVASTPEEKELMLGGANVVHMTNVLFTEAEKSLNFTRTSRLASSAISMYVDQYEEVPVPEEFKTIETKQVKTLKERSVSTDVTVAVYNRRADVLVLTLSKVTDLLFYKSQTETDDMKRMSSAYPIIVSAVCSVAPYGANSTYDTPFVDVRINHITKVKLSSFNTTVCMTWSFDTSNQYQGQWTTENCVTVYSSSAYTRCHCRIPAHIVAAVRKRNSSVDDMDSSDKDLDIILLVGYTLSMAIMLLTLYVYLRTCGQLKRKMYSIHLSFILCLFLSNAVVLLCLLNVKLQVDLTVFAPLALHFLYTTEFGFLLVEMLHVYSFVRDIQKLQLSALKCLLLGWGCSILLLLVVMILSGRLGHDNSCNMICWLSSDHWLIYSFMIPVGLFITCYVVQLILCLWELRQWKEEWRYVEKNIHIKSVAKSSSILALLLISCLLAVNLKSPGIKSLVHSLFQVSLVVAVFLNRCIFDKHVRYLLKGSCLGAFTRDSALKSVRSSGSFRAFIKPEKVANTVTSQEEYSVSRYYEEVNRAKYTNERKRQLSFLLGSSRATGGTGGTESTQISGSTKELEIETVGDNRDDGIAGQDSGIFVNNSEEELETVKLSTERNSNETDIHNSIFTDPLAECVKKGNKSVETSPDYMYQPYESMNKNNTIDAAGPVREPIRSTDNSKDSSIACTKTYNDIKDSPHARLKGRLQPSCSATCQSKVGNGYKRNPQSNLNPVLIAREGDLDDIDEVSVLVHNSKRNKYKTGTDSSACNSKLLSASFESKNDSCVSLDS